MVFDGQLMSGERPLNVASHRTGLCADAGDHDRAWRRWPGTIARDYLAITCSNPAEQATLRGTLPSPTMQCHQLEKLLCAD